MNVRVKFLGGAGSVTGSKFLFEIDDYKLLIDCGLFQGLKELRLRNWNKLPVDPADIDAVVITHAHIDHSGYLPLLVKNGYSGKIHCTEPTKELLEILLTDSAKLHEEEADFANRKGYSRHHPARPLYTVRDANYVFPRVQSHLMNKPFRLTKEIEIRFFNAGHILGAASVEIILNTSQGQKHIILSGDIGSDKSPLHLKPELPNKADILLMESTYGSRNRLDNDLEKELIKIINYTDGQNGCLIIPAFSVGRTQLVLYLLWKVFQNLRSRPVYVDSPMAISVTKLYKRFSAYHRLASDEGFGHPIFDAPFVHYVTEQSRSRVLNTIKSNAVIISASGMATGGRILHHLYHRLPREQDTILFTGFQAIGSRGRTIVNKEPMVRIFGEDVPIKARIENLDGFSAHADQEELLEWSGNIQDSPKMTFLVHGEEEGTLALKRKLQQRGWNVTIPEYLESFSLFDHI